MLSSPGDRVTRDNHMCVLCYVRHTFVFSTFMSFAVDMCVVHWYHVKHHELLTPHTPTRPSLSGMH